MESYRLIPLHGKHGEGKFTKVSPEDYERVSQYRWHVNSRGYVRTTLPRKRGERQRQILLHRLVLYVDSAPRTIQVDHEKGDPLDNRRNKLRLCTNTQNGCNTSPRLDSVSSLKGVSLHARSGKWHARITVSGVGRYLGSFDSKETAARAYDACARFYHGEFARTNFPGSESFSYQEAQRRFGATRQTSQSHYRGVSWDKVRGGWLALVRVALNGKPTNFCNKLFQHELDAARHRDAVVKQNGLKLKLNFPDEVE